MNTRQIALAGTLLLASLPAMAVQKIDRTQATGPTPVVDVSNVQGKVTVTAWDRNEVNVTGTIENDEHEFEFTGDTGRVTIAVRPESKRYSYGRDDAAFLEGSLSILALDHSFSAKDEYFVFPRVLMVRRGATGLHVGSDLQRRPGRRQRRPGGLRRRRLFDHGGMELHALWLHL